MSAITWHATPAVPVARPRLRITRRGRTVLAVLIAIPLAAGAVIGGVGALGAGASDTTTSNSFTYVRMQSGESLWQLAEKVAPNADPRVVVADITQLNDLGSGVVQPGQRIAIPAKYAHS